MYDDIGVCQRAQRIDGARSVQITGRNALIGGQIAFLVGTALWKPVSMKQFA